MIRSSIYALSLTAAVATVAHGQCSVTPPAGSIAASDLCANLTSDSNGGCNFGPTNFDSLGVIVSGGSASATGTLGTFIPAGGTTYTSRDLDWYSLSTVEAGTLNVSLSALSVTGTPLPTTVVFIIDFPADAVDCVLYDVLYGFAFGGCPHVASAIVDAGMHGVIVTVPFEVDAAVPTQPCDANYLVTVTFQGGGYPECGTSVDSCVEVHATGGCNDFACCETVCGFNPLCCFVGWDQSCIDQAIVDCGYFIYSCNAPNGAGDCLINPVAVTVGDSFAFDNTTATTDGPVPTAALCASAMGLDRWFLMQAPADGALTLSACASQDPAALVDTVIEIYGLGTDPVMTAERAQGLLDMYIGCVDDSCGVVAGTEGVSLIDAVGGEYYLYRIGGYTSATGTATGALTFTTGFEYVVYTTGPQNAVVNTAGALANLGLSSGCLNAQLPQRWLAQAFTVPTAEGATGWRLSEIVAKGFAPAGVTNSTMNWVIWNRVGTAQPVAADQVASGSVTYPVPYDDGADSAANASHAIGLDVVAAPGDYYLTVYAVNPSCATIFSNFAWFISAYNGVNLVDATGVFAWRSATFPTPGFARWTLGGYTVQAGADPNDIWNTAFNIMGTPEGAPPCVADLNGDGLRDGADLALMLGAWGGAGGDVDGDGLTDGADLALLLGVFGGNC